MTTDPKVVLLALLFALGNGASAQAPGYRLLGPNAGNTVHLVDNNDVSVHSWTGRGLGGVYYVLDDGTLLRTYVPTAAPAGYPPGRKGGVERLALDGTLLWTYEHIGPGFLQHHDLEPMPNGNVLMISWDDWTPAEAIAAGRDPALMSGPVFRPDYIIEVKPTGPTTGTIIWQWHVADHVIQDVAPGQGNFGVVSANPQLVDINYPPNATHADDWNHMNSVDYDPVNDLIVVSSREQDEIWVIDHSTTTAEAAGHTGGNRGKGGDLLYRWGNIEAYKRGTAADQQLFGQHGPNFIKPGYPGEGNIVVFNNQFPGGTQVWELVLPLDASGNFMMNAGGTFDPIAPLWTYGAPGFQSNIMSNAERLPNGNTLICSATQGNVFEVTPAGATVWSHVNPSWIFQAHYIDRDWTQPSTTNFAAGCASSGGSNTLTSTQPLINTTFRGTGTGLPAFAFVMAVTGFSPLTPSLALDSVFAQALPGCDLHVADDVIELLISNAGSAESQIAIPNLPTVLGLMLYHQMVPIEVDLGLNIIGVTSTNALELTIGGF